MIIQLELATLLSTLAAVMVAAFGSTAHAAVTGPTSILDEQTASPGSTELARRLRVQLDFVPFVKLVDSTNPAHTTTLNFGSNPGRFPDFNDMLGLVYLDGDLAGVTTGWIGGIQCTSTTWPAASARGSLGNDRHLFGVNLRGHLS
jgi:hypothetical protein